MSACPRLCPPVWGGQQHLQAAKQSYMSRSWMGLCKVAKGDGDNKSSDVRVSRRCRNGGGPAAQVTGQRQGCLGGSKGGCGKQNKKEQSGASCWSSGVFCRNGGRCGTAPGESSTVNVRIKKETRAESGRRLPRGSAAQRTKGTRRSDPPPGVPASTREYP